MIPCRRAWQPSPIFLLGESYEPDGLQFIGSQRVGHRLSTQVVVAAVFSRGGGNEQGGVIFMFCGLGIAVSGTAQC